MSLFKRPEFFSCSDCQFSAVSKEALAEHKEVHTIANLVEGDASQEGRVALTYWSVLTLLPISGVSIFPTVGFLFFGMQINFVSFSCRWRVFISEW